MSSSTGRATCTECGAHLSAAWRRVWRDNDGDPGRCRECASRAERHGTRETIGADLSTIRSAGQTPYTEPPTRTEPLPTTYAGPSCCRLCRTGLNYGRAILSHLVDAHPDVIATELDVEAPNHA